MKHAGNIHTKQLTADVDEIRKDAETEA